MIVACELTATTTDVQHLPGLIDQIRHHLRRWPREVSADAGYCADANLAYLLPVIGAAMSIIQALSTPLTGTGS